jgi:adenine C2-methylase RlmN of 23S rRNA A2503 and tRNA A37
MQIEKKDIRAVSRTYYVNFFVTQGDKAFRGNQVYEWLWSKGAHSFEDMTNISKETYDVRATLSSITLKWIRFNVLTTER